MKKIGTLILAAALAILLAIPVFAAEPLFQNSTYICDGANVFGGGDISDLEAMAWELSESSGIGIYVVTVPDYNAFGSSIKDACWNIHEAYGLNPDAIILLISIDNRNYYIQDIGENCQYALTDFGRECLEEAMVDDLREDNWYSAIYDYLEEMNWIVTPSESVFDEYEYDDYGYEPPSLLEKMGTAYAMALPAGLIIALIFCTVFKAQMKTARKARSAERYVASGGAEILIREDRYTHTTRTERRIQREDPGGFDHDRRSDGDSGGGGSF